MDTLKIEGDNETLVALRRERARQDEELSAARSRLEAQGRTVLAVPCAELEAIDGACLVGSASLTPTAIRG